MVIMKRTQCVELLKNIRINMVSFLAITVFVMFGIALYSGMGWSGQALNDSVNCQQDSGNMADIELIFPYGFDKADMDRLKTVDGVEKIEGGYCAYEQMESDGDVRTVKVVMLQSGLNCLTQTEGTLPQKQNEIAVEKNWAETNGIGIGDTVRFVPDGDADAHFLNRVLAGDFMSPEEDGQNEMQYLTCREFTVTALGESPAYISQMAAGYETDPSTHTPADCLMFAPESAFDAQSFTGYTTLFVKGSEPGLFASGTESYNAAVGRLSDRILPQAEQLAAEKCDRLTDALAAVQAFLPADVPEITRVGVTAVARENNASLSMLKVISDMFDQLKYNLSIPFILISILVSYSTISRTVYKDMRCIGTKKALGFKSGRIIVNYMLFAGLAALIGLLGGLLISRFVIERLFLNVLKKSFFFENPVWFFSLKDAAILGAIQLGCVLLSAFLAGRKTVKMPITEMLSGDTQHELKPHFYEKSKLWKRMPLLSKSIIRNCIGDKRRVAATLIGIAGCTALVICGVSLMLSVSDSFDYQFSQLQDYKYVAYFDPDSPDARSGMEKALADENIRATPVLYSTVRLRPPGGKDTVATLAVSDRDFDGLMALRSLDGTEHPLSDSGAWLSCAFALNYGIDGNRGTVDFTDASNKTYHVPCAGIYEFYLQCPRIAMSAAAYESAVGEAPAVNAFLIASDGTDKAELSKLLRDVPGFLSVLDYYTMMEGSFGIIIGVVSAIAMLYLVLSVLMALFILLDLFVMFVEEKKRELITLMINGYKLHYAKKYIYSDTVFLTVVGVLLGVVSGILLSNWNVNMMTSDVTYYLHRISALSCIGAAVLSALLTGIMCLIAMKRIPDYALSDLS